MFVGTKYNINVKIIQLKHWERWEGVKLNDVFGYHLK